MKDLKNIVGAHFIFGFSGTQVSEQTISLIKEIRPAGFIVMGDNYESPEQVFDVCTDLQTVSPEPLIISVDQEGGRVSRLKEPFLKAPTAQKLGQINSPKLCFEIAHAIGRELLSVGINLDFLPVCDILTNLKNTVIADRAFSSDEHIVTALASAMTRGLQKAGVMACAKHFPGHGDTLIDSHMDLPHSDTTLDELKKRELIPFQRAFKSGAATVMSAHILSKALDPTMPVTLSPQALGFLRKEMRFSGLIISDDMNMGALTQNYQEDEALYLAVTAGIDILLYCDSDHDHHRELYELLYKKAETDSTVLNKLQESYIRLQKIRETYLTNPLPKENSWKTIIGCEEHQDLLKNI